VEPLEGTKVISMGYGYDDYNYHPDPMPAVTVRKYKNGMIAAIWVNLGAGYLKSRSFVMRNLMEILVGCLGKPTLHLEGSHMVHASYRVKNGKALIHLINTGTQGSKEVYAYDEIVPVSNVSVLLKTDRRPVSAHLMPQNTSIKFTYENRTAVFQIPTVRIHEILQVEFE
jgi:hypothetical protein